MTLLDRMTVPASHSQENDMSELDPDRPAPELGDDDDTSVDKFGPETDDDDDAVEKFGPDADTEEDGAEQFGPEGDKED
jgi:hypothetical protein